MSTPTPVFRGKVERGPSLKAYDKAALGAWLSALVGEDVEITVRKRRDQRSARANAYLWVVYGYIAEETGDSPEDIHEFMKAKFLGHRTIRLGEKDGLVEEQVIVGSTAKLSTADFYQYVEKVRLFAAEWMGLSIPDPGEVAA